MKRQIAVLALLFLMPSCARMTCSQKRHRAIQYMNRGIKAYSAGAHGKALRDLKAAVKEDPNYVTAHYNLAKVYQEMKKFDEASKHLNRGTEGEPKNARAHYDLGVCYQNLRRFDLAKSAYQKCLGINPKFYAAHYRLGTLAEIKGKPKEADAAYRRAIEINPRFVKPFVKLGLLYSDKLDQNREAIETWEKLHELEQEFEGAGLRLEVRGLELHAPLSDHDHAARKLRVPTLTRVTVVGPEDLEERICRGLIEGGATRCTSTPCYSFRHARTNGGGRGDDAYFRAEFVVAPDVAAGVLDRLRGDVLPLTGVTVYTDSVESVPPAVV